MHAAAPTPATDRPALTAEPGVQADAGALVRAWWRIGVALVVAGQSMAFGLAANLTPPEGAAYWIVHATLAGAALVVCALLLPPLVREAWAALRARRATVELLFLLTLAGAFAASLTATLTHTGAVYYEVVSILLAVYSAGKTLGARSRARALRAVDETRERFDRAERTDGVAVAVSSLRPGDRVRVRPGGAIAVDGLVRAGRSFVQETAMTGEWRPLARGPGDAVYAGTHAIDGELEIEVAAATGARRLDAVLAAVAEARLAPSELQRQADRLTAFFLPIVLAVSAGTFAFWTWHASWVDGLFNSMAVLLVACPCALGLATPLAVWQGLARFATLGLVARTGDVLDTLARADVVCFDKTGTLSEDRLGVTAWHIAPEFADEEAWLRRAVAAVERGLPHPVARALAAEGRAGPLGPPGQASPTEFAAGPTVPPYLGNRACDLRLEPGCGVIGRVDGREVRVGAPGWLGVSDSHDGRTVAVAVDGRPAAQIGLAEVWRAGAAEAFAELAALGVRAEILTGDSSGENAAGAPWRGGPLPVGGAVTIHAGLTPATKLARIAALRAGGRTVVFVGDGLNDAAAMAAAGTAIAMNGGAALALAAAPAVFLGGDLRFLPAAIREARRVRRGIAVNLRFAAAYNTAGMALAALGLLHPVAAALLMLGSSAFVSIRALGRASGRTAEADNRLPGPGR